MQVVRLCTWHGIFNVFERRNAANLESRLQRRSGCTKVADERFRGGFLTYKTGQIRE